MVDEARRGRLLAIKLATLVRDHGDGADLQDLPCGNTCVPRAQVNLRACVGVGLHHNASNKSLLNCAV